MNYRLLTRLFLVPLFLGTGLEASPSLTPAEARITKATVFPDGAMVTREASLSLDAGTHTLVFDRIPASADRSFIQAELQTGIPGRILRASLVEKDRSEKSLELEKLEATLKEIETRIATVRQSIDRLNEEAAFARKLADSFASQYGSIDQGVSLTVEQAEATWSYTSETLERTEVKRQEKDSELNRLSESKREVEREINEQMENDRQLNREIQVTLELAEKATAEVELRYLVMRARWQPSYELRAEPTSGVMNIHYLAEVAQQSGEDWSEIELLLQTNSARRPGNVPQLSPWIIRGGEKRSDAAYRQSTVAATRLRSEAAPATDQTFEIAPFAVETEVTASTTSFEARLPGRSTVPSRNEPTRLTLLEAKTEADFWSEAVPALRTTAYLRASLENPLELPILPGEAQSFVDGMLSSRVYLGETQPGEEIKLSLGEDPGIEVKRRKGKQSEGDTGFIAKKRVMEKRAIHTVKNLHGNSHRVVIVDRFPISQQEEIEIKRLSPEASAIEVFPENKDNGIFQWNRTVRPGEEIELTTAYEIRYPTEWEIDH